MPAVFSGCWELIAYGILLNIIGAGCLLLKAIIDKGNTEALIHQKLEAHGTGMLIIGDFVFVLSDNAPIDFFESTLALCD
ncbi:unnamed protein product [Cylicostephanus goldi]|uniref:Uncharacterized protein n=1 Tax=Cylicostephanus goldi TaxID=71465 RepID=A0A3P6SDI2_CYLGO|nr:unnamed protein product [Cylicostephanus goldi]